MSWMNDRLTHYCTAKAYLCQPPHPCPLTFTEQNSDWGIMGKGRLSGLLHTSCFHSFTRARRLQFVPPAAQKTTCCSSVSTCDPRLSVSQNHKLQHSSWNKLPSSSIIAPLMHYGSFPECCCTWLTSQISPLLWQITWPTSKSNQSVIILNTSAFISHIKPSVFADTCANLTHTLKENKWLQKIKNECLNA